MSVLVVNILVVLLHTVRMSNTQTAGGLYTECVQFIAREIISMEHVTVHSLATEWLNEIIQLRTIKFDEEGIDKVRPGKLDNIMLLLSNMDFLYEIVDDGCLEKVDAFKTRIKYLFSMIDLMREKKICPTTNSERWLFPSVIHKIMVNLSKKIFTNPTILNHNMVNILTSIDHMTNIITSLIEYQKKRNRIILLQNNSAKIKEARGDISAYIISAMRSLENIIGTRKNIILDNECAGLCLTFKFENIVRLELMIFQIINCYLDILNPQNSDIIGPVKGIPNVHNLLDGFRFVIIYFIINGSSTLDKDLYKFLTSSPKSGTSDDDKDHLIQRNRSSTIIPNPNPNSNKQQNLQKHTLALREVKEESVVYFTSFTLSFMVFLKEYLNF